MARQIRRSDKEIDDTLTRANKFSEGQRRPLRKRAQRTYADGWRDAINWITGESDLDLLEDER